MNNTMDKKDWKRGLLTSNPTGLWRILIDDNTGNNSMYVNQPMLKLLGLEKYLSPEECYKHWFSRIEDQYIDYVNNAIGEMLARGEQIEFSYAWNHPILGVVFMRCAGKIEAYDEKNIYELRGYCQDITGIDSYKTKDQMSIEEKRTAKKIDRLRKQTKQLNEQLQGWQVLLRTLLQNTDSFEIYYYPKERRICFPEDVAKRNNWNVEYKNMPQSFSVKYVDIKYQPVFEEMFERIHNGMETTVSEISLRGGREWYHTHLSTVKHDDNGEPALAIGVIENITEKKMHQMENIQLENIYKFTVNNDYENLMIIDLMTNQYSVRYTEKWNVNSITNSDKIEETMYGFLAHDMQPEDLERFELDYIIDRLNSKKGDSYIVWYTSLSGEHKEVRCYWLEKNKKILLTIRNVEANWKKEEENKRKIVEALEMAKVANQAKSDFLSRMSHDIRTPLNAISGMTTIAQNHIEDTSRVEECLDSINHSSNYLSLLINDVLDMAKIESSKMKLNNEEFVLDEFLKRMLDIVKPLADNRKHELIMKCEDIEHQCVRGDTVRLQQLLLNILSNAIKYTNPNGKIEFSIKELASQKEGYGYYQFNIKDNGIGMDDEFLKRLFNPFERSSNQQTAHIEGTGLGMSIAKNIANLMEGDIAVESELNVGSTFSITAYLELQSTEQDDLNNEQDEEEIPDFSGKNILLVDDYAINIEIAKEVLSSTGANIDTAEDGKEAVERVMQVPENYYSMIFMDIRMPILNGYEAVRIIRNLDRQDLKTVPIIAMTADAFSDDVKRAKECGMNDHVAKPIDIDKLYDVMKKYRNFSVGGSSEDPQSKKS